MVLRNDYVLKLFNGDIGIALPGSNGELAVYFPDGEGAFRSVPIARMPEHETAFALTVHKSQGAEFEKVLTVLPESRRVLTRELLYTAVTRARFSAALFASTGALQAAIQSPSQSNSGLLARPAAIVT
jgi:exodeoxyribonuclease V alpha subunit